MSQESLELVRRAYEAYSTGREDAIKAADLSE